VVVGFFSKLLSKPSASTPLVDNEVADDALSLQVVFARAFQFDAAALERTLRAYSKETKQGSCQLLSGTLEQGTPLGLIGWGPHVIRVVGFNQPMPASVVEVCVAPAHYDQQRKAQVRAHTSHLILYYAGHEESRLEQYVALAVVAGVLAEHGAIAVLNESAHTSLPAAVLAKSADVNLESLRTMPLPLLFIGMVKYDVEGTPGVWMRTYGAHLLGLADFAHLATGHGQGEQTFEIFASILRYQLKSGARFAAGHTAQVGTDTFMKLRAPNAREYFLESDSELYVVEFASASEMNA
jgi:Domain of unknown function (DUF4261)